MWACVFVRVLIWSVITKRRKTVFLYNHCKNIQHSVVMVVTATNTSIYPSDCSERVKHLVYTSAMLSVLYCIYAIFLYLKYLKFL